MLNNNNKNKFKPGGLGKGLGALLGDKNMSDEKKAEVEEKIENLKPADLNKEPDKNIYELYVEIGHPHDENGKKIEFIKTITAKISYTVGNKTYSNTLERIKIKE